MGIWLKYAMPLIAVDFFCGAGGMSYGLSRAGVTVLAGIDNDISCKETYEHNNRPARFLHYDIVALKPEALAHELGLKQNDPNLIFVGCSPCQFWSKIQTDKTKSEQSAFLLREFQRFVDWFNPGFLVIENVPGLLTKKSHSILPEFVTFLDSKGFSHTSKVVTALSYGVPQNRRRFLLLASRVVHNITLPRPYRNSRLTVGNFIGKENGFKPILAGHHDKGRWRLHSASALSPENLTRIMSTAHDGGTRGAWKENPVLQIPAYEGRDDIFRDVYGRMFWNKPAPTITTRFNSLSNGRFGHPTEDRAISLREGATLQTFPKRYRFIGKTQAAVARLIGNAVPPAMAQRIGRHLMKLTHGEV